MSEDVAGRMSENVPNEMSEDMPDNCVKKHARIDFILRLKISLVLLYNCGT